MSFGNPALGTYGGCVFTLEEDESCPVAPTPAGTTAVEKVVAMTDVPPEQVPEGILNLARSHRPFIEHLRIMVASSAELQSTPVASLEASTCAARLVPCSQAEMSSRSLEDTTVSSVSLSRQRTGSLGVPPSPSASAMESAASILAADNGDVFDLTETRVRKELLTKDDDDRPSRTYVILFQLSTQEAADMFVRDLHNVPYTSLDETERCSVYHVMAMHADDGVSLMSPFFAPSASDLGLARSSSAESNSPRNNALEVHNCAVCLERMNLEDESLLTTVCNHSFHLDCLMQWQDSPCPVCRYDHSGLNEALSRCHVCGTTERNYVCLICGVVSCGGGGSPAMQQQTTCEASTCEATTRNDNSNTEGSPPMSHARQHYDNTLHAYALDTETQHVWDFCGQGYVHRLLQNAKDGKLVEVNDPNSTSHERSLCPGLSDAQEGEVVHRKLEGFASQYYTLLKSQLEQQRIYYESRLEEIRREYGRGRSRKKSASPSADLISALKQERNQLMQRCMTLRQRYEKVSDDVAFLKNMNESLEADKAPLKRQIMDAQRHRAEAREMIQKRLPPLEEKVTMLMLQLEESMNAADNDVEQAIDDMSDKKPATKR